MVALTKLLRIILFELKIKSEKTDHILCGMVHAVRINSQTVIVLGTHEKVPPSPAAIVIASHCNQATDPIREWQCRRRQMATNRCAKSMQLSDWRCVDVCDAQYGATKQSEQLYRSVADIDTHRRPTRATTMRDMHRPIWYIQAREAINFNCRNIKQKQNKNCDEFFVYANASRLITCTNTNDNFAPTTGDGGGVTFRTSYRPVIGCLGVSRVNITASYSNELLQWILMWFFCCDYDVVAAAMAPREWFRCGDERTRERTRERERKGDKERKIYVHLCRCFQQYTAHC